MQIVTNLASNACKFTPPGGLLRIATRLILPACSHRNLSADTEKTKREDEEISDVPGLSAHSLEKHNLSYAPQRNWVVVRIEVTDTGCGIPPKEMVQSKLFCESNSVFPESHALPNSLRINSCVQPDGAGQAAGREGNWSRPCSCQADSQAKWRAARCQFSCRQGVHVLG